MRFHLSIYNYSTRGKERKWKKRIGEIVGEEPVLFDSYLTQRSCDQLQRYLVNKGYPKATVTFDTIPHKKKIRVNYIINEGAPLKIGTVKFDVPDSSIRKYIVNDTTGTLLKTNTVLDIDKVQEERLRITNMLKNKGYYFFTKEDITYEVDTIQTEGKANLVTQVFKGKDSTYAGYFPYTVNSLNFFVGFDPKKALETGSSYFSQFKSIEYEGCRFYYIDKLRYHPKVLLRAISMQPEQTYQLKYVNSSYRGLTSLKTFRLVNIQFSDSGYNVAPDKHKLDAFILLTPLPRQSYQVEAVGTHSSGNLGIGGNFLYQNRNTFKRSELLEIKLHGAIERQTVVIEENDEQIQQYLPFNSLEMGGESSLFFHTFLFPFTSEKFKTQNHPKTSLTLAYNYQQRPDFSRTITNGSFGYFWEGKTSGRKHYINPIEVNFVQLPFVSKKFRNSINNTFLENSYSDHLVVQGSYTYLINDLHLFNNKDLIFFRTTFESAGNLIDMLSQNAGLDTNEFGSFVLFKTPYAQFLKCEADFRYFKSLWFGQKLVYRLFAGAGYPYGNLKVLPFEKRYFSGGANGIRAWNVRSLGPGSFTNSSTKYANQTGDIKIEANLEYRFKLFWVIEGALFADAGNIWDIYQQEDRPGGVFEFNKVINDMAIGAGIGMRFDFSFFIFRLDWGVKVRDPAMPVGSRIVITDGELSRSDYAFNIGIGYPF